MGKYTIVNSACFRPYMKAGKMSIVEVKSTNTSTYINENFMTDEDGNYVQFVTEDAAVSWLCDNIKTELIHEDYVEKLIRPSINRGYWLKEEVQESVREVVAKKETEVVQLDSYRLYVENGTVTVVRIMGGNTSGYNEYQFMDNADRSKLVFESEREAVEWMATKLTRKTIHPDYLEKAGYTVYDERLIPEDSDDSPSGFSYRRY
ncbi:hypothetical protein [Bacillus mycoides]|uniref:hypothetical protein n=1 Tax=Bacillus mycoides TaxID=1405 RepID=UPI003A802F88